MYTNKKRQYQWFVVWGLVLGVASGCSGPSKPASEGQGVAKVNGDEITVHQVNDELVSLELTSDTDSEAVSMRVLDTLIDQNIAVQRALEWKLDRNPQVMRSIERAKRHILADAYLDKFASSVSEPTQQEVDDYYTQHPELFEKNKVYFFQTLTLDKSSVTAELHEKLNQIASLHEITATLEQQGVVFEEDYLARSAGQLNFDLLGKVVAMERGDIIIVNEDATATIYQLIETKEQPITKVAALPAIHNYLLNSKRQAAMEAEVKRLRALASVEYLGKFAKNKPTTQPAVATVSNNDTKPAVYKQSALIHDKTPSVSP